MVQTRTARQELAYIERRLFKGAGLDKASRLEGEERRAYRLAQVERLLTEKHGSSPLAMYLSDMFWTADEGRVLYDENPSPLLSLTEQQTLTDREMRLLRLILEIAGLCHDLSLHFTFDLDEAIGIKCKTFLGYSDFWVSNKQLVEWLNTTEYEQIAMHTAYTMKKFAIGVYAELVDGRTPNYVSQAINQQYHRSFNDMVNEFRIREACRRMNDPEKYGHLSYDFLAQGLGFKSYPNFVRNFKKFTGLNPSEYQKQIKESAFLSSHET